MIDFTALSPSDLASFFVSHQSELDAEGISEEYVMEMLRASKAVAELRPYGFALIQLQPAPGGKEMPHLWALYIDEQRRGSGLGLKFLREILKKYSRDYHMTLYCVGSRRRSFFGRAGFRVETRDGEMRRMTTNPDRR